jgi:hypothetical protein
MQVVDVAGFGFVVPSGAEWYDLVPKMCPYCVRPKIVFAERPVGRIVTRRGLPSESSETTAEKLGGGNASYMRVSHY